VRSMVFTLGWGCMTMKKQNDRDVSERERQREVSSLSKQHARTPVVMSFRSSANVTIHG
jgi:hypothetical protein